MKQLLYLVISLVIIAAITPAASAYVEYPDYNVFQFGTSYPVTMGPDSWNQELMKKEDAEA